MLVEAGDFSPKSVCFWNDVLGGWFSAQLDETAAFLFQRVYYRN